MKEKDKQWIDGFFQGYKSSNNTTLEGLQELQKKLNKIIKKLRREI